MKPKILIISFLCFSRMLFSQDSIRVETVVDTAFKTPQYELAFDDVFLSHQETKWLLKGDLIGLLGLNRADNHRLNKPVGFEFEHKLSKSVSLNVGLKADLIGRLGSYNEIPFILSLESRWYLNQKKLQASNQSENNLNGSYVSLRTRYTTTHTQGNNTYSESHNKTSVSLNYGIQKRVFNNMYFNYRVGIGAVQQPINSIIKNRWDFGFENEFTLGLALGGGKKKTVNSCDLFRCFENEHSLWKFDVSRLLPVFNKNYTQSNLNAAYEFKLRNSKAWSINTNLDIYLNRFRNSFANSDKNFYYNTAYLSLAPRYYYNINKDIAKGKSANNLSGCYLSLEIGGSVSSSLQKLNEYYSIPIGTIWGREQSLKIIPKWGIQKRLFKNGFMDFSVAPYWYQRSYNDLLPSSYLRFFKEHNYLKTDFKIGFAF
jgi:hypothetical protein